MKQAIEKLKTYIKENDLNVFDIAGMDKNGLIYEKIRPANSANNSYSVSKSFTGTAFGVAFDKGLLTPETLVLQFFTDKLPKTYDKKWESVQIKHLLTHTFGSDHGYLFEDQITNEDCDDWTKYVFTQPLNLNVGERLVYSNVGCYLTARIIEKVSGTPFDRFVREEIFDKLGFRYYGFITDHNGNALGASGMVLRTIDCAKFGYMYANSGVFDGKRVLSEEWVKLASTTAIIENGDREYTVACFWREPKHYTYYADGAYGQFIFIEPKKGYSIAVHAYIETPAPAREFAKILVKD